MRVFGFTCLWLALVGVVPAPGQTTAAPPEAANRTGQQRQTDAATQNEPSSPLLDRPVSRTEYELGPGDVISVSLFGDVTDQLSVPISPEGAAVIPTIGSAQLLGLNLEEAERRVRTLVNRLYTSVEVRVTLERVRSFKVFVLGSVTERGVRTASAATRASEVLPSAGSRENPLHRRNVTLRRANGDTLRLDIIRFLQTGDLSANPYLREGDALVVPALDQVVEVHGRVAFPGTYEFRPGESLAELLRVVNGGGGFPANAADTIRLARFTPNGTRETLKLTQAEALGARGRGLTMRGSDAVYVPMIANFRQQRTASVQGQVRFPGEYPIREDTTTLRDLILMAGWFTPEASLSDATLRRVPRTSPRRSRELEFVPDSALSSEERRVRDVAAARAGAEFVVVDYAQVFASSDSALDVPLRSGDVATIPRRRQDVTVLGAVLRPGVVPYSHGKTYQYYVALAGGYGRRADRSDVTVIRAGQGNSVAARDVWYPQPGDDVVVPFRERHTLLERVQTVSGVASTLTTAILGILALTGVF